MSLERCLTNDQCFTPPSYVFRTSTACVLDWRKLVGVHCNDLFTFLSNHLSLAWCSQDKAFWCWTDTIAKGVTHMNNKGECLLTSVVNTSCIWDTRETNQFKNLNFHQIIWLKEVKIFHDVSGEACYSAWWHHCLWPTVQFGKHWQCSALQHISGSNEQALRYISAASVVCVRTHHVRWNQIWQTETDTQAIWQCLTQTHRNLQYWNEVGHCLFFSSFK